MATNSIPFNQLPQFQTGRNGEQVVQDVLMKLGWYIVPSYDYTGTNNNKAPKLNGLPQSLVIPDLDISGNGIRLWVEVKTKEKADYTYITQRLEHGIPLKHYEHYQKVEKITGCKVWLFIYEKSTQEILCASLNFLSQHIRIYSGSKMNYNGMAFFPRSVFLSWSNAQSIFTPHMQKIAQQYQINL